MTLNSGKVTKARCTKCITKLARPAISQVHFFFLFIPIFLYGLKYSTVYPATNHTSPPTKATAIHPIIVLMFYSIMLKVQSLIEIIPTSFLLEEENDPLFT